jgi:hypothetical protein
VTAARPYTPWWRVSEWEFREACRRTRQANALPRGQRDAAKRCIASEYGVSPRTLERWIHYEVHTVRVAGYAAMFIVGNRTPSQVTPWEKVA